MERRGKVQKGGCWFCCHRRQTTVSVKSNQQEGGEVIWSKQKGEVFPKYIEKVSADKTSKFQKLLWNFFVPAHLPQDQISDRAPTKCVKIHKMSAPDV